MMTAAYSEDLPSFVDVSGVGNLNNIIINTNGLDFESNYNSTNYNLTSTNLYQRGKSGNNSKKRLEIIGDKKNLNQRQN